jgi:hypothetical protein
MKSKSDPNGIRTRVTAVKGRCPGPLDDRVTKPGNIGIAIVGRKANCQPNLKCTDMSPQSNDASFSVSRSELVNQPGCPRGRALVLAQSSMCALHETLACFAVTEKVGNSALERVGVADLDHTVI